MKKKLLITLGCSFTEGVGCYDPALVQQYPVLDDKSKGEITSKSTDRFHALGWPARLQQKLNYDKLINLGKAGTGESFHLKRFIEEFGGQPLSNEYDVLIVWMTSPPGRLSFYAGGCLRSILSNRSYKHEPKYSKVALAYTNLIEDVDLDTALEQAFYIKTLKEICNGYNYKFLLFPLAATIENVPHGLCYTLNKLVKITENMSSYYNFPPSQELFPNMNDPKYKSLLACNHPNENGYEVVAERMFNIIQKHDSTIINYNENVTFENEWRGSKKW